MRHPGHPNSKEQNMPKLMKSVATAALLVLALPALAGESSLARMAKDKDLQWGPCPPFLPDAPQPTRLACVSAKTSAIRLAVTVTAPNESKCRLRPSALLSRT